MPKSGFKQLNRKLRGMRRDLQRVDEKLVPAAVGVASAARANVLTGGQIWRGNLAASFAVRTGALEADIVIENTAFYAAFVEYGIGPKGRLTDPFPGHVTYTPAGLDAEGNPPGRLTMNILAWVHTKPNFIGPFGPMTRDQVGFAIAKTIAVEGTNAHPFMRPAWFEAGPQVVLQAEREVRNAVRRN